MILTITCKEDHVSIPILPLVSTGHHSDSTSTGCAGAELVSRRWTSADFTSKLGRAKQSGLKNPRHHRLGIFCDGTWPSPAIKRIWQDMAWYGTTEVGIQVLQLTVGNQSGLPNGILGVRCLPSTWNRPAHASHSALAFHFLGYKRHVYFLTGLAVKGMSILFSSSQRLDSQLGTFCLFLQANAEEFFRGHDLFYPRCLVVLASTKQIDEPYLFTNQMNL